MTKGVFPCGGLWLVISFGQKGDIDTECELDLAVRLQQQGSAEGGFKLLIQVS